MFEQRRPPVDRRFRSAFDRLYLGNDLRTGPKRHRNTAAFHLFGCPFQPGGDVPPTLFPVEGRLLPHSASARDRRSLYREVALSGVCPANLQPAVYNLGKIRLFDRIVRRFGSALVSGAAGDETPSNRRGPRAAAGVWVV